jgi:hypothetical protein
VPEEPILAQILQKMGVSETVERFKFGGFVVKLFVFGAIALLTIAAVSYKLHNERLIFIAIIIMAVLGALVAILACIFAFKNPITAMLEGAEIIKLQQIQLAAKGITAPLALQDPIPDPAVKLLEPGEIEGQTE